MIVSGTGLNGPLSAAIIAALRASTEPLSAVDLAHLSTHVDPAGHVRSELKRMFDAGLLGRKSVQRQHRAYGGRLITVHTYVYFIKERR
jgi:hypothetical protein